MVCVGYLLFFAIVLMIFNSVSFLFCVRGNVVMREIMCLYAAIFVHVGGLMCCGWWCPSWWVSGICPLLCVVESYQFQI
jgi:hypothetical protein